MVGPWFDILAWKAQDAVILVSLLMLLVCLLQLLCQAHLGIKPSGIRHVSIHGHFMSRQRLRCAQRTPSSFFIETPGRICLSNCVYIVSAGGETLPQRRKLPMSFFQLFSSSKSLIGRGDDTLVQPLLLGAKRAPCQATPLLGGLSAPIRACGGYSDDQEGPGWEPWGGAAGWQGWAGPTCQAFWERAS